MIPRPVLVFAFVIVVAALVADVGGQLVVPGHSASPVLVGGCLTIIGAALAGSRGPKPEPPPEPEPEPDPEPVSYRPRHGEPPS